MRNTRAPYACIPVPGWLFEVVGSVPAMVYAYMRWEARMQGDVYTGSLEQLAGELKMESRQLRESLETLEQARMLRDITPEMGDRAHAWVVTTDA